MPCTPWQETQVATCVSPAASRRPWTLVRYSASWSVGSCGLNRRMKLSSAWQRPQRPGIAAGAGRPTKPFASSIAVVSGSAGSPPWQSAHESPALPCTSTFMPSTGASSGSPSSVWHATQLSAAAAAASRAHHERSSRTARRAHQYGRR